MAIRTYDILLDSYNSTMPEPIIGRQGDKNGAVTLHVTITDRGTAVNLTGQTVNLIAETAKGTAIVADNGGVTLTDAVNGKFDYKIPNALWSESGKIKKAYFSLNDTDGQQTTYDLIFIVKKSIDTSQDKADDYITIIDGTIRDLKTKVDAIYATYQAGDFYSKTESDSRFYSKAQTDEKDTATLASTKSYADTGDSSVLTNAKTYADTQDSKTLTYAKAYADTAANNSIPHFIDSLNTLKSAYPNGDNGIWVTGDGHQYTWYNNTWNDGGVYLSEYLNYGNLISGLLTVDFSNNQATIKSGSFISRPGLSDVQVTNDSTISLGSGNVRYIVYDITNSGLGIYENTNKIGTDKVVLNVITDGALQLPYNRKAVRVVSSSEMLPPERTAVNIGDTIFVNWDTGKVTVPSSTIIETSDNGFVEANVSNVELDFSSFKDRGVEFMLSYDNLAHTYSIDEIEARRTNNTNQGRYYSNLILAIIGLNGLKFLPQGSNIVFRPFGEERDGIPTILNGKMYIDTNNHKINFSSDFILGLQQAGRFESISYSDNITYTDAANGSSINTLYLRLTLHEKYFYVDIYPRQKGDFRILTFWNGKAFGIGDMDRVYVNIVPNGGRPSTKNPINIQQLSRLMYDEKKPTVKIANLGDSTYQITGTDSTEGRWSDLLQPKLIAETGNPNISVVNGGFSGKSIQWIGENFDTYFGSGKQFDGVQFLILGFGLNNGTGFYNLDEIKATTQNVIERINELGISVALATTQATNRTQQQDRQQFHMFAAENAMRKELAYEMNIPLIDLNTATQIFLQHSQVTNSNITFDGLHFAPRGHIFEAEWIESQLSTRCIEFDDEFLIDSTLQNTRSDAPQEWIADNPDFDNGFKTKFLKTGVTTDTLMLDTLLMNMNKKPIALTAYAGTNNSAYLNVNGTNFDLKSGKNVIYISAEIGIYNIKVMSGTGNVDFEGLKFER